jgi:uncharacterized damage-inducible protein DinB
MQPLMVVIGTTKSKRSNNPALSVAKLYINATKVSWPTFANISLLNNESIGSLMIHSADTYVSWLVNFARQEQRPFSTADNYKDQASIRATFEQINLIVNDFLNHFKDVLDAPLTLPKKEGMELTHSPLQLFTHVITHEFHHKGQIMNMSRQLGYIPVDTDVIRF